MRLSKQLHEALTGNDVEDVDLAIGQHVVIYPKGSEDSSGDITRVCQGDIQEIDVERKLIRLRDRSAGDDVQIDVDVSRYDVWVDHGGGTVGLGVVAVQMPTQRASKPGPYAQPRWGV